MTKREDQMRGRIHDVEEQLVKAAIMVTEARELAEAAETQREQLRSDAAYRYKKMQADIDHLKAENWQLKQALGYSIPADKDTPQNPFKCGTCEASHIRAEAAEKEAAALKNALREISWKSIDRDNMEFQATITCWQMDTIIAALEAKP